MALTTRTIEIPASYVIENGSQATAEVVGGTTALSTIDGDMSYAHWDGYFRWKLPPTLLSGPIMQAWMVAVGKIVSLPPAAHEHPAYSEIVYTDSSQTTKWEAYLHGHAENPTAWGFPIGEYGEVVVPLTRVSFSGSGVRRTLDQQVASGTGDYLYNLWLEGNVRLTYLALRVEYIGAGGNPPEQIYPRSDGLGIGSADQVYPIPNTYQASPDQWGGYW